MIGRPLRFAAVLTALLVPALHARPATAAAQAVPYAIGDRVEAARLLTQDARPFRFDDGTGRAIALSFVYTRCTDAAGCPAVSARFARLQSSIDPQRVRLVLLTIAPREDTPAVLRRYGAAYRADPARWTFVTGDAREIASLAARFGIARSDADPDGALDHAERLIVLDGTARIADAIPGANWAPGDARAAIDAVAGLAYDPLRRAAVHLTWSVEHTCGLSVTGAAASVHHAAIAAVLLLPPGPLLALLGLEVRRRRRSRRAA
ncbi:MAG TPA: SCO family protein [Candidatus Elarobacter sp.]